MLDALFQDLRYALKALRSTPAFAAVAILSLALGIGANTAIFSLIDSVMLKTLPVSHPEQLLQVRTPAGFDDVFTNPLWEQIRDRQDVFSTLFAYSRTRYNLATGGEVRNIEGTRVSGQYFESLGIHAVLGRTLTADDDKRGCAGTAVLSHDFWQRAYAGRTDVVGQTISLNGHPFEIIGVTQPGFSGIEIGNAVDVTAPICSDAILDPNTNSLDKRSDWWLRIIGRPKPGISAAQVTARLNTQAPEIFKATLPPNLLHADQQAKYLASTFNTAPAAGGFSYVRYQYRLALLTLMVVVGVVLLIACANVANLLLARGAARQREIAIRMALGSGRARLIRQLLTESLLLSFAGAALGVVFAQWGTRLLVGLLSTSRSSVFLNLSVDGRMLAFTAGVASLTGLLFGLAPAWRGTRVDPQSAMKANARGVIEGSRFGLAKMLVMIQVALSLVLVVGAGLMLGTFWKLSSLDTGFDRQNVLLVRLERGNAKPAVYGEILDRVRAIPGVRSASMSGMVPLGRSSWQEELDIEGYTPKSRSDVSVMYNSVTPGYFDTLSTPVVMGRDFNQYDTPQSPSVAIVNETFARRYYGSTSPLGRRFRWRPGKLSAPVEIVGVVKDAKYASLREKLLPTMFIPETQVDPRGFANIEIRANADIVPSVKAAIEAVNRDISLQFAMFTTQIEESLVRERLLATLSGFFGGLALLLAIIGLYGVMSYNVARRRNEIGIRMALGAEQSRVLRMVLGEVGVLVFIGLAIGLAAAMATTRFVQSFLYGLTPNDPWVLGSAAAVLALVALVAGYLPARRAARLDPMSALREE